MIRLVEKIKASLTVPCMLLIRKRADLDLHGADRMHLQAKGTHVQSRPRRSPQTHLVPPTQGLCRTLGHTDMVKFTFILELDKRRDRVFHGDFGVYACAFKEIKTFRASQFCVDEVDAPRKILGS